MDNGNGCIDKCEALTIKQVGEMLHVSRPTVEKWIKNGELPSLELGGCRRVRRTDLDAFMSDRRAWGWRNLQDSVMRPNEQELRPPLAGGPEPPGDDIPF